MINNQHQKNIAVVGLGYVGLPLALLADKKGYHVIGIDQDEKKIKLLESRIAPYADEKINKSLRESSLHVTTDWKKIKETSIVILCVPTPVYENHLPNLEPLKSASEHVAKHIKKGHLIILESTVNPGVCEGVIIPILEKISGMIAGQDFYLSHCPERINPGDKKWTLENIPRVVGSLEPIGLKKATSFYRSIISGIVKTMKSLKEAEAVKIIENSFRDINIAFVNELAQSFSHLGIDVVNVIKGAATKPFSFMAHFPSCGVGGHCIPVDPYYLIDYAKRNGYNHRFLSLAREINNGMPKFTVDLVKELLEDKEIPIAGAKVTVLGIAYKANIEDCRESPALEIIKELEELGALVTTYDPYVKEKSTATSLDGAITDAQVVVIATAHDEFKNINPRFLIRHNVSAIVDGQNCLPEQEFLNAGIMYEGIGKYHNYDNHHENKHLGPQTVSHKNIKYSY